jgi:hypothetical protein
MKLSSKIWLLAVVLGFPLTLTVGDTLYEYKLPAAVRLSRPAEVLPPPPASITKQYAAALDVARVFGRSPGCTDASPELITAVATEAIQMKLEPRILAATIAVESACNQYAVSNRGAIGLMQVVARTWKDTYDFSKDFNLLNRSDNLHVGASILAGLIKQYGQVNGLRRFNGLGDGCATCDAAYPSKITVLAGVK